MARLSSVLSGYIAACVMGGVAAVLWAGFAAEPAVHGLVEKFAAEPLRLTVSLLLGSVFVGFFLFLTVWPAALVLGTVAFVLRIRTWLYYALGGVLAGLIGAWLVTLNPDTMVQEAAFSSQTAYMNMVVGGWMATVYWLLVHKGRTARGRAAASVPDSAEETQKKIGDAGEESTRRALLELEQELKSLPEDVRPGGGAGKPAKAKETGKTGKANNGKGGRGRAQEKVKVSAASVKSPPRPKAGGKGAKGKLSGAGRR